MFAKRRTVKRALRYGGGTHPKRGSQATRRFLRSNRLHRVLGMNIAEMKGRSDVRLSEFWDRVLLILHCTRVVEWCIARHQKMKLLA